jgi:hypothetical protein
VRDGAPLIDQATIDLEIDLNEMPDGVGLDLLICAGPLRSSARNVHPSSHRAIGLRDSEFRQQILDVRKLMVNRT